MKIQKRRVNVKRHVRDYKIAGKWRSRDEAVKLAKAGRIEGVAVYRRNRSSYIQALPSADFRLSDLPMVVAK